MIKLLRRSVLRVLQQVKDIYGEVSLREFARECAGAAQIGIVVRAVATVDIVLNHVDTPEDVFLESASLAEVPVGSAGRAADTILAAMRINGGNGVYAESLTELCELAPAAQSAADKCLALIASQSNENDADSTNANGSGGEVDPFSLLAGHEDLLCAAQEAAYLSAALLAKLRLCASEFDNQPEPSEQDRSRVTDLKREFKVSRDALSHNRLYCVHLLWLGMVLVFLLCLIFCSRLAKHYWRTCGNPVAERLRGWSRM